MAARLIKKIRELAPELPLVALPLVGEGEPVAQTGVPILYAGKAFPSGGFIRSGLKYLIADLRAGYWRHWRGQIHALRRIAPEVTLILAVGDSLLLYLVKRHLGKPLIFVPTAKSEYIRGHLPFEVRWMRQLATVVFPRDSATADKLAGEGVPAEFVGNLMMDSIDLCGYSLGLTEYGAKAGRPPIIGILPGSREEAYPNFNLLAQAAAEYTARYGPAAFPVALAGHLDEQRMADQLSQLGWRKDSAPLPEAVKAVFSRGEAKLLLCKGAFGDILDRSDLILGLAGTANEQAAGLGKPVITFVGLGSQFTRKFVAAQKRLLGEAVSVVWGADPDKPPTAAEVAAEIHRILSDPEVQERMAVVGKERMGRPGGVTAVAERTIELYRELSRSDKAASAARIPSK